LIREEYLGWQRTHNPAATNKDGAGLLSSSPSSLHSPQPRLARRLSRPITAPRRAAAQPGSPLAGALPTAATSSSRQQARSIARRLEDPRCPPARVGRWILSGNRPVTLHVRRARRRARSARRCSGGPTTPCAGPPARAAPPLLLPSPPSRSCRAGQMRCTRPLLWSVILWLTPPRLWFSGHCHDLLGH
jgi:hypothetical protein